jgi:electron transfer flavoprotein beta subunit
LDFGSAALKIGDYDLNALEEGAQLAAATGSEFVALTANDGRAEDSKLRKNVLSRGPEANYSAVDDSLASADSYNTAQALKAAIAKIGDYDLILTGEGSADSYSQQVGIQLGALLGIPALNAVNSIALDGDKATITRLLDDEVETLEVQLPAVFQLASSINTPRIPSMKDILGAGKKPSTTFSAADLGLSPADNLCAVVSTLAPEQKARACEVMEGADEDTLNAFVAKIKAAM